MREIGCIRVITASHPHSAPHPYIPLHTSGPPCSFSAMLPPPRRRSDGHHWLIQLTRKPPAHIQLRDSIRLLRPQVRAQPTRGRYYYDVGGGAWEPRAHVKIHPLSDGQHRCCHMTALSSKVFRSYRMLSPQQTMPLPPNKSSLAASTSPVSHPVSRYATGGSLGPEEDVSRPQAQRACTAPCPCSAPSWLQPKVVRGP